MNTEIQKLEEQVKAINEQLEKLKQQESQQHVNIPQNNGFFVPDLGKKHWLKRIDGNVCHIYNLKDTFNSSLKMSGNCFRTKEQAEAFDFDAKCKRMEAWQMLNSFDEGWVEGGDNYRFEVFKCEVKIMNFKYSDHGSLFYCRTFEKAEAVRALLGDELIKTAYGRV